MARDANTHRQERVLNTCPVFRDVKNGIALSTFFEQSLNQPEPIGLNEA